MTGISKTQAIEITSAIRHAQSTFMLRMELAEMAAKEMKARFDILIAAGFTPEQAIELIKAKAL